MSRTSKIAIGALVVLLAAAPFVPRGADEDGPVAPSGDGEGRRRSRRRATAGPGRVTPAMRAEIERVVDAGRSVGRIATKIDPDQLARQPGALRGLRRPALLPAHRLDRRAPRPRSAPGSARAARAVTPDRARRRRDHRRPRTRWPLLERAGRRSSPQARATAERQELTEAARSVAKVWLLRHQIQGVALPATSSRATRRPAAPAGATRRPTAKPRAIADYPERGQDAHRSTGLGAAAQLLVRPDDDADDRLGLAAREAPPAALGAPAAHHRQGTAHLRHGARGQPQDRLRPAEPRRAATSCSTSPPGRSASGCCCRCGTSSTTARRWCCTRSC